MSVIDSGTESGTDSRSDGGATTAALKPAKPPVGTGASPLVAQLIALVVIALGVVGVQEALVRTSAISQGSWTSTTLTRLDGVHVRSWMLPAFAIAVLLGLALLVVVLRPRPRKAVTVSADTGVYLRTGDVARMAHHALEGTSGLTEVSCRSTRRRLRVEVSTLAAEDRGAAVDSEVRERLEPLLTPLASPPRVSVDVHHVEAR